MSVCEVQLQELAIPVNLRHLRISIQVLDLILWGVKRGYNE